MSTTSPDPDVAGAARLHAGVTLAAVVLAWAAAFREPLRVLVLGTSPRAQLLDAALVTGIVVLAIRRRGAMSPWPRPALAPLAVTALAVLGHAAVTLTIHAVVASGIAMVLAAWGLAGLWLPQRRWLQAFPLVLAGVCALPIGPTLDLYVGFPLRMASTRVTHALLAAFIEGDVSMQTVLVIDAGTRGVQVDLPCSGVRSLYCGAIAWAAATWFEHRRVGACWLLASGGFVIALVLTNLARVIALVLLHTHVGPRPTELLHLPLGMAAFSAACAAGWWLLHRVPATTAAAATAIADSRRVPPLLLVVPLLAVATVSPRASAPTQVAVPQLPAWAEPLPLEEGERASTTAHGADALGKWRVSDPTTGVRGQLLLVRSRDWRAHHQPDACHHAAGRAVVDARTVLLAPEVPVRWLALRTPQGPATGVYWFQSSTHVTEDHDARAWASLSGDTQPWVMVSLTLDGARDPDDAELRSFLDVVGHEAAALARSTDEELR